VVENQKLKKCRAVIPIKLLAEEQSQSVGKIKMHFRSYKTFNKLQAMTVSTQRV